MRAHLLFLAVSIASSLTLGVGLGCSTTEGPGDAAAPTDAGAADASASPDASPASDALPDQDAVGADAPSPDATPDATTDAEPAPDREPAVDVPGADTGVDPRCAFVAQAQAGARLGEALGTWARRCNPELTVAEAQALGALASTGLTSGLAFTSLAYSGTDTASCACAVESAGCELVEPQLEIRACRRVVTGTVALGDVCRATAQCVEGTACVGGPGIAGVIPQCPTSVCDVVIADGQPCTSGVGARGGRCGPGSFCNLELGLCQPTARAGEACDGRPCRGEGDSVLFATTTCSGGPTGFVCAPLGRSNAACGKLPCHALFTCEAGTCALRPGDGDPCQPSLDTASPTGEERLSLLFEASQSCRVGAGLGFSLARYTQGVNFGWACTQTGATTGQATCTAMPAVGAACGFGAGLSPACAGAAYCPGLDPFLPQSQSQRCVGPTLSAGGSCRPDDQAYGLVCAPGLYCEDKGQVCLPVSCLR